MISPNVIIAYVGTHASIPAGFIRFTALDSKYPKGHGDMAPGNLGGSNTHTHNAGVHSHSPTHHTHSVQTSVQSANPDGMGDGSAGGGTKAGHYHGGTTNATTGSTTETITWGSASNDPPYYEVIFIQAVGYQLIPQNGLILRDGTTRTGLTLHSPSLGKYLKGATAGGNAGGIGGSYQNTHYVGHTHASIHSHTGLTDGSSNSHQYPPGSAGTTAPSDHKHGITLYNATVSMSENSPTTITVLSELATNIEPVYRTLNPFYSASGTAVPVSGDIALWSGSVATVPLGWKLCDGSNGTVDMRNRFLKAENVASTTGGRNTHSHTGVSHSHSIPSPSHSHSGAVGYNGDSVQLGVGGTQRQYPGHSHDGWFQSIGTNSVSFGSATTTPTASDNQPTYYTVAYIQFDYFASAGMFFAGLI